MGQRILIVGGAVAGPAAAVAARAADKKAEILLLERAKDVGFATGGLAYYLGGEVGSIEDLAELPAEHLRAKHRVDVRLGVELVGLSPKKKTVTVEQGSKREELRYDKLIVAAGARSQWPTLPPSQAPNVFKFRSLSDLRAIDIRMRRHRARRIAIIGGGYIGLEAAEGFQRAGCQVTVIEKGSHLLDGYPADFYDLLEARLHAAGVDVHCNTTVQAVKAGKLGAVDVLTLSNGVQVKTDLVVVAAGIVPNAELLVAAGAVAGPGGSVLTDACMRTSLPGVFAAGVCAAMPHGLTGEPVWFAQAAPAFRSGTIAGHNAASPTRVHRRVTILGTALLRVFDCVVGRTGLDDNAAARFLGGRRELGRIEASVPSRDGYFSDAAPLLLRLLFSRADGRILGAQAFGTAGVDKLLDTLATAIAGSMTIAQLAEVDLAYCPPLAPLPGIFARLPMTSLGSKPG